MGCTLDDLLKLRGMLEELRRGAKTGVKPTSEVAMLSEHLLVRHAGKRGASVSFKTG